MLTIPTSQIQRYIYTIKENLYEMLPDNAKARLMEMGGLMREDELDAFERTTSKEFLTILRNIESNNNAQQFLL
ncbi:MAG: hypothetical protein NZM35_01275 [Chitinophagales bacterium]|nr:hypothetical protein [Chitinophagales bacterium]MDW8418062.1 hypothetical protein [Chitinophagales bacterium]